MTLSEQNGYDQVAGSDFYTNHENYNISYEYWEPQKLYIKNNKLKELIPTIPKYYYCRLSKEEYDRRHKIMENIMNKYTNLM